MKTSADLFSDFKKIRKVALEEVPKGLAYQMEWETRDNFHKSSYGNDDSPQRWPDRPHERQLLYKPLMYTMKLYRSIKPVWKRTGSRSSVAMVRSSSPLARVHNEGGRALVGFYGSNGYRNPPSSTRPVYIGRGNIQQRQFMGFGRRSRRRFRESIRLTFARKLK